MRDDAAQSILQNGERLERLIEDLLYVSRVENHRPPLHLAWDDVVAIAADVVASCARRHEGRSILIDGPGNDLPIYTDRVKVEQILTHLIENAVKYSAEGTDVRVRILPGEHTVQIDVIDAGVGVYSGDIERIFDPFTQLDSTSTREAGGTGIGLYVSRTLTEALGGRIGAESVLAKGSTFSLVLPRKSLDDQRS